MFLGSMSSLSDGTGTSTETPSEGHSDTPCTGHSELDIAAQNFCSEKISSQKLKQDFYMKNIFP